MKKIITLIMVIMLSLFPRLAFSEQKYKPVDCFPFIDFYEMMENRFGEKPAFILKNTTVDSTISLLVNKEDGTWTLVEHNSKMICILGMGKMPMT